MVGAAHTSVGLQRAVAVAALDLEDLLKVIGSSSATGTKRLDEEASDVYEGTGVETTEGAEREGDTGVKSNGVNIEEVEGDKGVGGDNDVGFTALRLRL